MHTAETNVPRLLIATDDAANGGTAHVARHLALGLRDSFAIEFACVCDDARQFLAPVRDAKITIRHYNVRSENLLQQKYAIAITDRLLNESSPDIVLCVDSHIASLLALKHLTKRRGIPYIILVNCVPPDCRNLFAEFIGDAISRLRDAARIVFVSDANRRFVDATLTKLDTRSVVIPNSCDEVYFGPRNPVKREEIRSGLGIGSDEFACFTAARLEPQKGQFISLRALKRLADEGSADGIRLVLAGRATGADLQSFLTEIDRLNLAKCVTVLGERHDIADLLDASDCFILTSFYEGMPLAIAEAMAKGLPIIATAVGGVPEQLDQSCGVLLPSPREEEQHCVEALAHTLGRFRKERSRLREMGVAANKRARTLFNRNLNLERYRKLVAEAVGKSRSPTRRPDMVERLVGISGWRVIEFRDPAQVWNYASTGWSFSERTGVWTEGSVSTMCLQFSSARQRVELRFEVKPFIDDNCRRQQTNVLANGTLVGCWDATQNGTQSHSVELNLADTGTYVELRFLHDANSGRAIGSGSDGGQPRFLFRRLYVLPVSETAFGKVVSATVAWMHLAASGLMMISHRLVRFSRRRALWTNSNATD
jgi:glycosyltransferase involved in cell wall biosynthesis